MEKALIPVVCYKGSNYILSKLQLSFFHTLSNGNRHSSHQLMQQLHTSDPRKEIQYLRDKGIDIQDEWIAKSGDIPRHKRYWIDPKDCKDGQGYE